jgi:hypothetical protein
VELVKTGPSLIWKERGNRYKVAKAAKYPESKIPIVDAQEVNVE